MLPDYLHSCSAHCVSVSCTSNQSPKRREKHNYTLNCQIQLRADVSPDGRTQEEVSVSCALEHPHLTRVIGIVPGPSCQPPSEQPLLVCGRGFVRWRVCVCVGVALCVHMR
jgi:hypothetical protein